MSRIIIICEGETEREFCNTILAPFFLVEGIYIETPLIKRSMGGIVKWAELKKQILLHLKGDKTAYTTTFIDYYGLYKKYGFPEWDKAEANTDKNQRMEILERGMFQDIDQKLNYRFIPYIQLHEFEGLLFNEISIFQEWIPENELIGLKELESTLRQFTNPEMINNNKETSPSKRLTRIIDGYEKIIYGNILADAIGIERIRAKCPRFNRWIEKIQAIAAK